ncbi:tetratricopeptide repeat protein [Pseudotenacibaculum sp. MALMAid0570]|uniref:type IX secretion system periplasmic lipoprotein PorW/SprE n=1 Tax=Pseudotenacibaculum sp. MALMAid0570 TaxID=3143938 RepID=UPI0032DE6F15
MKNIQKIGFLGLVFLVVSCSTRKDAFLNRSFHSVTTKYNVLYNGKVAFQQGIDGINSSYEDDYWQLLPIEPIKFKGNVVAAPKFNSGFSGPGAPGAPIKNNNNSSASPFEKAEEKAVKAIQKHSMNIRGREKNKQIDDAYLLLGKSRYYTERFIPAIEAFNYIIANYPKASLINETKIWRAKANIRIDNVELAIETLKILLRQQELPELIQEEAHTALAMAYMKMDSIHRVKEHLWLATNTSKNKVQRARNMYVLGQLYTIEKNKDSATLVFENLVNFKKAPYKYRIHANIELAKNSTSDSSTVALLERFKKLIRNRDNRPYLDALYYQVAALEEGRDSIVRAKQNYNYSLRAKNGTAKQKTFSYEKLADLYFSELDYVTASSYYDSVLITAKDKQTLRIKKIERKAKNLASLRKYEEVLKINDSILSFVAMPEEERKKYFQSYIDKIKKKDEEEAQKKLNAISFGNAFGGTQAQKSKGKWYFYNVQSLGFGKGEFERVWGTRALEDNWRWSEKISKKENEKDDVVISQKIARYEISTYLKSIPSEQKEIDSLVYDRNKALFELGLIYKEQFKNTPKAISNLERLLQSKPDKELILPANYHLYQIYLKEGDSKAETYKNVVLNDYADTPFAKIILNPEKELAKEEEVDEISDLYSIAYNLYKDESFEETVCFITEMLPTIEESTLIPRFYLLKAYAIGKYQKKESYIAALEKVAVDYPQTEQGKKALELIKRLKQ